MIFASGAWQSWWKRIGVDNGRFVLLLLLLLTACQGEGVQPTAVLPTLTVQETAVPPSTPAPFITGFDASYVSRVEDGGGIYRNTAGDPAEIFQTLASYNIDIIRLRVWVDPSAGYNNQEDVLRLAQRAHEAGLGLLIDFHYSDDWADPGKQVKPKAWRELDFEALETAVFTHTEAVIAALIAQGTPPNMVQIGNEIINGMVWPEGRVGLGAPLHPDVQWQQLTTLLKAGVAGVRATGSDAQIMMHIDYGGAQNVKARWFFDHLIEAEVPFDLIGLSYYPQWHGTLDELAFNIQDTVARYQQPVIIVETSTLWTLAWNDWTDNAYGLPEHLHPGFEATPQGQQAFLQAVVDVAKSGGAMGVFYWGGEWIAAHPEDQNGSVWENQALFDFDGRPLPALTTFAEN